MFFVMLLFMIKIVKLFHLFKMIGEKAYKKLRSEKISLYPYFRYQTNPFFKSINI